MPSNSTNPTYLVAREYWNWINANFTTLRGSCDTENELEQLKADYAQAFQNYLDAGNALLPDTKNGEIKAMFERLVSIKASIDSDIDDLDKIKQVLVLITEAVRIVSVLAAL